MKITFDSNFHKSVMDAWLPNRKKDYCIALVSEDVSCVVAKVVFSLLHGAFRANELSTRLQSSVALSLDSHRGSLCAASQSTHT